MLQPTYDVFLDNLREKDTFEGGATGNLDMNLYQILEFRIENIGALPSAGNKGRVVYLTTDNHVYLDTG